MNQNLCWLQHLHMEESSELRLKQDSFSQRTNLCKENKGHWKKASVQAAWGKPVMLWGLYCSQWHQKSWIWKWNGFNEMGDLESKSWRFFHGPSQPPDLTIIQNLWIRLKQQCKVAQESQRSERLLWRIMRAKCLKEEVKDSWLATKRC